MEYYHQHSPFSIQIEPTEGCNLGCSFCGLRGMREKGTTPWKFMKLKTATDIARKIAEAGWLSKVMFAMHGEPTLNPKLLQIIRTFRQYLPSNMFYIISNGYGFTHDNDPLEYTKALFKAGINHIILDNYAPKGDWSKIVRAVQSSYPIIYFGKDKTPMFRTERKNDILVLPPINMDNIGLVRNLVNHSGAAAPLSDKHNHKRCTMPFREMSFRYNGFVALCCDDFRGAYNCGNIKDYEKVDDLWNNERFQAARIMLYNKSRSFKPCMGCTNQSVRVGLLPDPTGHDTLEEITPEVAEFTKAVGNEGYLSKIIIKRPWEQ